MFWIRNRLTWIHVQKCECLLVIQVETKGGYFYNPKENKVFVSMNVTFLEDSYVQDFKSRSKVMLEDMSNNIVASEVPNVESDPINEERQTN